MSSRSVEELGPVWVSMAEHFLDTETRHRLPATALACVEAGLSDAELARVWRRDVTPLLRANLTSIAGEWSGWDEPELLRLIAAKRKRPGPRLRGLLALESDPLPGYVETLQRLAGLLRQAPDKAARTALAQDLERRVSRRLAGEPSVPREDERNDAFAPVFQG